MKKISIVSLVAVLAAMPMMANATDLTAQQLAQANIVAAGENEIGDAKRVAAVSYVKGAYKELGDAINTKQDQLMAGETEVGSTIATVETLASTAATASDSKLVSEKAILTAIEAIESSANSGIGDLQSAMSAAESDIDDLQSAMSTANGNIGDLQSAMSAAESDISGLQSAMSAAESDISGLQSAMSAAESDIDDLQSAVSALEGAGYITNAASDLQYYTTTTALQDGYATKAGVTSTISASTVSGSVPVLATWGSSSVTSAAISASITGAIYTAE